MMKYEVIRAEEEWQRAGAYSVRIQGMNRQHHISLREEFDEHDTDGTRYIVLLDDGYPIATCRFYEISSTEVILGRVVVLPEYRGKSIGRKVVVGTIPIVRSQRRRVVGGTAIGIDVEVHSTVQSQTALICFYSQQFILDTEIGCQTISLLFIRCQIGYGYRVTQRADVS